MDHVDWSGSAQSLPDHKCATPIDGFGCSFEQWRVHFVNSTASIPWGCIRLTRSVAERPASFTGSCLPGVLMALLARLLLLVQLGALPMDAGRRLECALEFEGTYTAMLRLWPKPEAPLRWQQRWKLTDNFIPYEVYAARNDGLQLISVSCVEAARAKLEAGDAPADLRLQLNLESNDGSTLSDWTARRGACDGAAADFGLEHAVIPLLPAPPAHILCDVASRSSQGQDLWVLKHLADVSQGFFIEIGANHPEAGSNSYLLEKAANWSGICIEPFPRGNWFTRRAELVLAAIGATDNGLADFALPGSVWGGLVDTINMTQIQVAVPENARKQTKVVTRTVASVLNQVKPQGLAVPRLIHYLSIDVEGADYRVLRQFPFENYTVIAITIEHHYREPDRSLMHELLMAQGYVLDQTVKADDFFLLKGYKELLQKRK